MRPGVAKLETLVQAEINRNRRLVIRFLVCAFFLFKFVLTC